MNVFHYDPHAGYQWKICEICGRYRLCSQHHFDEGRHSDLIIWICDDLPDKVMYVDSCHKKVHNPTAFKLPANWAYDNGYMTRTTSKIRKKTSNPSKWTIKKKCKSAEKWKINKFNVKKNE